MSLLPTQATRRTTPQGGGRSRTRVAVADLGLPPRPFLPDILLPTLKAVSLMLVRLHSAELGLYLCPSTASQEHDRLEWGGKEASLSRHYSRQRVLLCR